MLIAINNAFRRQVHSAASRDAEPTVGNGLRDVFFHKLRFLHRTPPVRGVKFYLIRWRSFRGSWHPVSRTQEWRYLKVYPAGLPMKAIFEGRILCPRMRFFQSLEGF